MQTILLLPALAAVCFGAAIPNPQEWGSATSLSQRPQPTYTIVVPCFPGVPNCTPQTYTLHGRDAAGATAVPRAPQVLESPSRTLLFPTPPPYTITSTVKPSPPSSTKKPSSTSSTKKPSSTSSTKKPSSISSTKKPSSTSSSKEPCETSSRNTHYRRQVLGSPTRTVLLPTPIPTTSSTKKPSFPTHTFTWPWWHHTPPPPPTTRYTSTGGVSTRTVSTILTVPIEKRQDLGTVTRTVLLPTTVATISDIYVTKTQYVPTTKVTTVKLPTTLSIVTTATVTTTTCTEQPTTWDSSPAPTSRVTSYGDGGTSRTVSSTLTVPYDKRQVLGPYPSFSFTIPTSISWIGATPLPTRTYNKRQVLGEPTRSFTFIAPTTVATETRSATFYKEI